MRPVETTKDMAVVTATDMGVDLGDGEDTSPKVGQIVAL